MTEKITYEIGVTGTGAYVRRYQHVLRSICAEDVLYVPTGRLWSLALDSSWKRVRSLVVPPAWVWQRRFERLQFLAWWLR